MKNAQVTNIEGSKLSLDTGSVLLLEIQGLKMRLKTEFLGMDKGRFIMVRTPAKLTAQSGITPSDPITVRFLKGENLLCGFNTSLLTSINRPSKITFLAYPEKYVEMNLRHTERLDCFIPATMVCDGEEWAGLILNISTGGCMFVINDGQPVNGLKEGSEVFALYRLPGNDEELFSQGTIRNMSEYKGRNALGLSFDDLADDVRIQVDNFITDLVDFLG